MSDVDYDYDEGHFRDGNIENMLYTGETFYGKTFVDKK